MELHGSKWRIKKRVPSDLRKQYPQFYLKDFLSFNTGKSDKAKAAVKCWAWIAEREEEFQRVGNESNHP